MDESHAPTTAASWRGDAGLLTLLVLLSVGLHAWMIGHTAVVARDSIGYIRYAMLLEQLPFVEAVRKIEQHPLYPIYLRAVSIPVRHFSTGSTAAAMSLSCQLASSLAGILLVFPMYFLGRALFDRRVGFWGAALFQCLPICVQVTSDGLSDALFLFLACTALTLAVISMQRRSAWLFALAGIATGFAYLTRPEGALVAVAALLAIGIAQWLPELRWEWPQALRGSAGLLAGAAAVALPYMLLIGGVSNKPTTKKFLAPTLERQGTGKPAWQTTASTLPLASTLAVWWMDENQEDRPPVQWVSKTLAVETMHAFHYGAWVPALLALWFFRGRIRREPALWIPLVVCLLLGAALFRVVRVAEYLSERHTLVIVVIGCVLAAASLVAVADRTALRARGWLSPRWQVACTLLWLLLWTAWCLPASLKPLHANRAGHRAAGEWLAAHIEPDAEIVDPFSWAHFYSDQDFSLFAEENPAPSRRYVVITNSKNPHIRLSGFADANELKKKGTLVFAWTPTQSEVHRYRSEAVEVYAVP